LVVSQAGRLLPGNGVADACRKPVVERSTVAVSSVVTDF
jgi:hypothetical protein